MSFPWFGRDKVWFLWPNTGRWRRRYLDTIDDYDCVIRRLKRSICQRQVTVSSCRYLLRPLGDLVVYITESQYFGLFGEIIIKVTISHNVHWPNCQESGHVREGHRRVQPIMFNNKPVGKLDNGTTRKYDCITWFMVMDSILDDITSLH